MHTFLASSHVFREQVKATDIVQRVYDKAFQSFVAPAWSLPFDLSLWTATWVSRVAHVSEDARARLSCPCAPRLPHAQPTVSSRGSAVGYVPLKQQKAMAEAGCLWNTLRCSTAVAKSVHI